MDMNALCTNLPPATQTMITGMANFPWGAQRSNFFG